MMLIDANLTDEVQDSTIEQVQIEEGQLVLQLASRQGPPLTLRCVAATLLNVSATIEQLAAAPRWMRKIHWAAVFTGDILYLALVSGASLSIRTRQASLEPLPWSGSREPYELAPLCNV